MDVTAQVFRLCRDEDDVQVFLMSDQRLVVLEITVTNEPSNPLLPEEDGDDAHAAQLFISLPDTLSYAGSRIPSQVQSKLASHKEEETCSFAFRYLLD